jgi:hypothetical protein
MMKHRLNLRFNSSYFKIAVLLLIVEILIAVFMKDQFIRPFGGDFLIVIFIYYFVKSFLEYSSQWILIAVLLFAISVEFTQYFNLIGWMGLSQNRMAQWLLGTSFSWIDMIVYTLGVALIWVIEANKEKRRSKMTNL